VRVPLSLADFGIDWQRLADAISPRTRLLVVNTPLNPAGAVLSASDWDRLADLLVGRECFLLSDEVYESLVFDGLRHAGVLGNRACAIALSPSSRSARPITRRAGKSDTALPRRRSRRSSARCTSF
jgi:aspartate/methionine/tyrosine aminotransferase